MSGLSYGFNFFSERINYFLLKHFTLTNFSLYLHPHCKKGRVAQLVQSTWFTPKGSGVRIPSRPQRLSEMKAFFYGLILTPAKVRFKTLET